MFHPVELGVTAHSSWNQVKFRHPVPLIFIYPRLKPGVIRKRVWVTGVYLEDMPVPRNLELSETRAAKPSLAGTGETRHFLSSCSEPGP